MRNLKHTQPMMSGDDVRQVQRTVGAKIDGLFGPETESKVIDFQGRMGLVRDGIVGAKTWSAILEYSGEEPAVSKTTSLNGNSMLWGAAGVMMLAGIGAAVYNNRS